MLGDVALLAQRLTPADALATRAVEVEGDQAALSRFVEIFAWPVPEETGVEAARHERVRG